jgi:hypothetical protein
MFLLPDLAKITNLFPIIYGGHCLVTAGKLVILYKNITAKYKDIKPSFIFADSVAQQFKYNFIIPYSKFEEYADGFTKKYELSQSETAITKFCEENEVPIFVNRSNKTNMNKCTFFPTEKYPDIPDAIRKRFGCFFTVETEYNQDISNPCVGEESLDLLLAAYSGNLCAVIGNMKSTNSFRMMFPDSLAIEI